MQTVLTSKPTQTTDAIGDDDLRRYLRLPPLDYRSFQGGHGGRLFRALGYSLDNVISWGELRRAMRAENNETGGGVMKEATRFRSCSSFADGVMMEAALVAAGLLVDAEGEIARAAVTLPAGYRAFAQACLDVTV